MSAGLSLALLSIHGLLRGRDLELGRDADTGGQTLYVLELARALGRHPRVARVDLITRLVEDPRVSPDYAVPEEPIGPGATIVRLPFGPRRYLRKELLWPHLDGLVDRCLAFFRARPRFPHLVHSHYADAGWVAVRLCQSLGIPLVHTGHSLGREKRRRLLSDGRKESAVERQFHFRERIAAEEEVLEGAALVVASTAQEVEAQWASYEAFRGRRLTVNPPGVDTSRFAPPGPSHPADEGLDLVGRFLADPGKPPVLAIARPAPKKNLARLVEAFASDAELRRRANLVVVAGTRDDVRRAEEAEREVLTELLHLVDRHDLWGSIALPKRHAPEDVPALYRFAARRHGVFVNVALTEPFGLTLLEAAASGLPVVATADGGPRDVVATCRNGLLVDPLDTAAIARAVREALSEPSRWRSWARAGLRAARRYTWDGHVERHVAACGRLLSRERKRIRRGAAALSAPRLRTARWVLVTDIDDTLVGDAEALTELVAWLREHEGTVAFGVATGRTPDRALEVLRAWDVPTPEVFVTSVGSEIRYAPDQRPDAGFSRHIRHRWRRDALAALLSTVPGLVPQRAENQGPFKLSYDVDPRRVPADEEISRRIRRAGLHARLVSSQGRFLDVLPLRAGKGLAIRFLSHRLGVPLERFLVAGDSGNDTEMLRGETLAVVVANHKPELECLRGAERVYFARRAYAGGILEGISHYGFAGSGVPQQVTA